MAALGRLGRLVSSLAHSNVSSLAFSPLKQLYGLCNEGLLATTAALEQTQIRTRYINWQMRKDAKRRATVKEYAPLRLRFNSLTSNTILPKELQELAAKELSELPRDSNRNYVVNRCVVTSRSRGKLRRWRMSRIVWRNLADYNKLSGVTRAFW